MRFIYMIFILSISPFGAWAQDTGNGETRFQPPRPPPIDPGVDFDDMDEDMMEVGDDGAFRPPPPPPPMPGSPGVGPGGAGAFQPPPMPGGGGGGGTGFNTGSGLNNNKVRFQIVDEFFERGKKRTRGQKLRASGGSGG